MTETNSGKSQKIRDMFMRIGPNFKSFVVSRFDEMEEFKRFTLAAIENEKKAVSDRFGRETESLTEEQKEEYFDWNAEDYFMVDDVFTRITLRSFVVILFSYIEDGLNTICSAEYSDKARFHKKQGLEEFTIRYTDKIGKGIDRAKAYLEDDIGAVLHTGKKPWNEIQTLREIRNSIVHADGSAHDKLLANGNIKQHIKKGLIKITVHGQTILSTEYLDYILPYAKKFFTDITLQKFAS